MFSKKNDYYYFKEIKSAKVSIREFKLEDINAVFAVFSNPNVTKYLSINTFTYLDDAKSFIEKSIEHYKKGDIFYLGIVHNEINKVIGYIGLSKYDLSYTTCQVV